MKPTVIENFLDENTYNKVKHYTNLQQYPLEYNHEFKRMCAHNNPFFRSMHQQLEKVASEIFKTEVRASYCFLSLYGGEGICPKHSDRPQCKYTIDLCIECDKEWDIFIDDVPYTSRNNNAICYSGTDTEHWRNRIEGRFMNLVFFHFVPIDFKGPLS